MAPQVMFVHLGGAPEQDNLKSLFRHSSQMRKTYCCRPMPEGLFRGLAKLAEEFEADMEPLADEHFKKTYCQDSLRAVVKRARYHCKGNVSDMINSLRECFGITRELATQVVEAFNR